MYECKIMKMGALGSEVSWQTVIDELLPSEHEIEHYFERLWPICRSITGNGFRKSLKILSEICPFEKFEVPSGTPVFDWTVPKEWNVEDAYIEDAGGHRIVDFQVNNLHLLGYSTPVDTWLSLEELKPHLFFLEKQPTAIPYLTSYYSPRWGFCLSYEQFLRLSPGRYHVVIKTTLEEGSLTYGHRVIERNEALPGQEIFLSSYLCHPSLANNELSGPIVLSFLARALEQLRGLRFNYRCVIVPETIGSITYLFQHGAIMKDRMHAGYVLTCLGDNRKVTYKRSRREKTIVNRITEHELSIAYPNFETVDFFPGGSDERQYCSVGFDLPVGSIMRSMYGTYPEYHTSLDNRELISWKALRDSIAIYLRCILALELNRVFVSQISHCEPMLGRRGLYPALGAQKDRDKFLEWMMWIINQSDGTQDLAAIASKARCSILDLEPIARRLVQQEILREPDDQHR